LKAPLRKTPVTENGRYLVLQNLSTRAVQEDFKAALKIGGVLGLAFPDGEDFPALGLELAEIAAVAGGVAEALGVPILGVVDGVFAFALAGMHVPEAAVNVDYLAVAGQDDIGLAGEVVAVEAIAVAKLVDEFADDHFWRCVAGFDRRHDSGALGFCEPFGHVPILGARITLIIVSRS